MNALAESPAELARRIGAGDDSAAEERLVERYARGVKIVLDRHTRDDAEAEDLFQETFRLAIAKLRAGELREPAKLPGFLASLAKNLAIEHYRKAARRQTDVDSEAAESAVTVAAGNPLGRLLRGEEAHLVRRALGGLTTGRDREVLFRFYIAEEDKDKIAADHGLTSLQFNRILHRARQRYKALYLERLEALGHTRAAFFLGPILAAGAIARLLVSLELLRSG